MLSRPRSPPTPAPQKPARRWWQPRWLAGLEETEAETTSVPPNAAPEFGLSQIVFGDSAFIILTNWGAAPGSLEGYWLSQGTVSQPLPDVTLGSGEQAIIGLAAEPAPELTGMAAVIQLGPAIGPVDADGGEVALYASDQFEDTSSLIAYVTWGAGAADRFELAVEAGIWDDERVAVIDDAPSISTGIYPANSALDWSADVGG